MLTVAETEVFKALAERYWSENERLEFIEHIAANHDVGSIVPKSGGVRKVRWAAKGKGKRGGVRVIYFNMVPEGKIWLLTMYGKNVKENISAHTLKMIKEVIENE